MRKTLIASSCLIAATGALGLSACGGDSRPYDQVPASTPALVPPADANDVAAAPTTTPTTTTPTDTTGGTGVDSGGTSGTNTGGGTPADTGGGTGGGTPADTGGIAPN